MKVTDFFTEYHKQNKIGITDVRVFHSKASETYSRFPISTFFTSWQKTRNPQLLKLYLPLNLLLQRNKRFRSGNTIYRLNSFVQQLHQMFVVSTNNFD